MTGLVGSTRGNVEPRKFWHIGRTFKHWGGTLSGEGLGFRVIKPR